jgi:MoaA/NifB/PqqE/SkfB family radical SAM enzyme
MQPISLPVIRVIYPEDWPKVDELVDWLIEKNKAGYKMVNSVKRLQDMKEFMRGKVEPWNCRAGQNSIIIRVDGTLAPCFPMYSAKHDWGVNRESQVRSPTIKRDEEVVPNALLLHLES